MNKLKETKDYKYKDNHEIYKTQYYGRDNKAYIINQPKYEETIYTIRRLNPITETYEYETKIANHQLDWENTELMLIKNLEEKGENEND